MEAIIAMVHIPYQSEFTNDERIVLPSFTRAVALLIMIAPVRRMRSGTGLAHDLSVMRLLRQACCIDAMDGGRLRPVGDIVSEVIAGVKAPRPPFDIYAAEKEVKALRPGTAFDPQDPLKT